MKATELDKKIGASIEAHRKWAQVSRIDLAKKIGVTPQQLYKYEKGTNRAGVNTLLNIAEALNINYTKLIPLNLTKLESIPQKALDLAVAINNLSPANYELVLTITKRLKAPCKNSISHS